MIDASIFKANDVRGIATGSDVEWDAAGVEVIAASFVHTLGLESESIVLGHDMRTTGVEFARAFSTGARSQGADVVELGLTSTDEVWFASGRLGVHGVQLTASHNPPEYNGIKFCLPNAAPITPELLVQIRDLALAGGPGASGRKGTSRSLDILPDYAEHVRSLVDLTDLKPLRVVVDAGNGMAGLTVPAVLAPLDCELVGVHMELDGTFPNHPANPLVPANLVDASRAVVESGADLGLVFDGDADRCVLIDELGRPVGASVVTAMIAQAELHRHPGATIVVNTLTSRRVHELVAASGGKVVVSRVGHTFVKALMTEHNAVFGGEHSAHYYFRDFWYADTGIVPALMAIAELGRTGRPLSELVAVYGEYPASGEINSQVADIPKVLDAVEARFADRGQADRSDGVTVSTPEWWLNVRPSNSEPLVRLNVEAHVEETMEALRDEALALIRGETDARPDS